MPSSAQSRRQPPVFFMLPARHAANKPDGAVNAMATAVKTLGVAQFLASLPCIGLGVAALLLKCQRGDILTGIWVGALICASGLLGIGAGSSAEQCPLTSYYMMSILNTLAATVLITMEVLAILQDLSAANTSSCDGAATLCLIINTLLFSLGVVHFFLAMTSSIISILLNSKVSKIKDQVVPLIPYPVPHAGNNSGQPELKSLPSPSEEPGGSRPTSNEEAGRVKLGEIDFGDEGFKFS